MKSTEGNFGPATGRQPPNAWAWHVGIGLAVLILGLLMHGQTDQSLAQHGLGRLVLLLILLQIPYGIQPCSPPTTAMTHWTDGSDELYVVSLVREGCTGLSLGIRNLGGGDSDVF